jgi:ABC-type polysaccharide/polyol phosphate transport system ATPase subunit
MNSAIVARNIYKSFSDYAHRPNSLKTILVNMFGKEPVFGPRSNLSVLEDINFEIKQGEFVGIMGPNGAGKSTMLKLIAGIYQPTKGEIEINGAIGPMIALGAGFDGELTGLENIYLNAAILGFSRHTAARVLSEIIEFSELEDFMDMPIKKYSSGMLVRLGFSVVAHLDAPILLIDEALSVGDIGFQKKCIKKIHKMHEEGRTVVLVTHSPDAVINNCKRCIVIANKHIAFDGPSDQAVEIYRNTVKQH